MPKEENSNRNCTRYDPIQHHRPQRHQSNHDAQQDTRNAHQQEPRILDESYKQDLEIHEEWNRKQNVLEWRKIQQQRKQNYAQMNPGLRIKIELANKQNDKIAGLMYQQVLIIIVPALRSFAISNEMVESSYVGADCSMILNKMLDCLRADTSKFFTWVDPIPGRVELKFYNMKVFLVACLQTRAMITHAKGENLYSWRYEVSLILDLCKIIRAPAAGNRFLQWISFVENDYPFVDI